MKLRLTHLGRAAAPDGAAGRFAVARAPLDEHDRVV